MRRIIFATLAASVFLAIPALAGNFTAWDSDNPYVVDDARAHPDDRQPDSSDMGSFASVAVGHTDGLPRVAYYYRPGDPDDPIRGQLMFAWYDGLSWHTLTVHDGTDPYQLPDVVYESVGKYCSLALDDSDNAYISYYNETRGELWFAQLAYDGVEYALDESIDPNPVQLDPEPPGTKDIRYTGQYSDIAVSSDGSKVVITYYDGGNSSLRWITRQGGVWSDPGEYSSGSVGRYTSVVLLPDSEEWFAVFQKYNSSVSSHLLGLCESQPGIPITIDAADRTGYWPSLMVDDSGDTPYVAVAYRSRYYDEDAEENRSDVRLAWTRVSTLSSWDNRLIVEDGLEETITTGVGTSLTLFPKHNLPLIGYATLEDWGGPGQHSASRYCVFFDTLEDLGADSLKEIDYIDDGWRADPAWHYLGYFTGLGGYYNESDDTVELWALYQDFTDRRLLAVTGHEAQPQLTAAPRPLDFLIVEGMGAGESAAKGPRAAYGAPPESEGAYTVYLPSGVRIPREGEKAAFDSYIGHLFVQLRHAPTADDLARLRSMGVVLLQYHSGYTWWARVPRWSAYRLSSLPFVRAVWNAQADDRVAKSLRDYLSPEVAEPGQTIRVRVRFHADVWPDLAVRTLARVGATPDREEYGYGNTLDATIPASRLADLAASDVVMWISPIPVVAPCNQTAASRSKVGVANGQPWYLLGDGVNVGIWEPDYLDNDNLSWQGWGAPDTRHPDLLDRLWVVDGASLLPLRDGLPDAVLDYRKHATHVAGTIIGSGAGDETARGMAPQATLYAYNSQSSPAACPNHSDDDRDERLAAARLYHIAASNHSYGAPVGWDPAGPTWYGLDAAGLYDQEAASWDDLIFAQESEPDPITAVFAAGNSSGQDPANGPPAPPATYYVFNYDDCTVEQRYYDPNQQMYLPEGANRPNPKFGDSPGAVTGTACAKNTIVVGATYYDGSDDEYAPYSSTGPTLDGRIKPDVVATGGYKIDESHDYSVWSTVPVDQGSYDFHMGTSMAAPVVTGICALVAEQYNKEFLLQPTAATMRAILCNTAQDIGRPGPDYKFGWGLVDAGRAVKSVSWRNIAQGTIDPFSDPQSVQTTYEVYVQEGLSELRVMLCWSDPPSAPQDPDIVPPSLLVNKLQLSVVDPDSHPHYPYVLDPDSPTSSAGTGLNFVDNILQVRVPNPTKGIWKVTVTGADVMQPPQPYTLVADSYTPILKTSQQVVLKNVGDGALEITGMLPPVFDPSDPGGWLTVTPGWTSLPLTLQPGEYTTMTISVDPDYWPDRLLFPYRVQATVPITWQSPGGVPVGPQEYDFPVSMIDGAGAAITPSGVLRQGWVQFSIPVEPYNPDATAVLDDAIAAGNVLDGMLHLYNNTTEKYMPYPTDFTQMHLGEGYWFQVQHDAVEYLLGVPASSDFEIPLGPAGKWSMWGYPFLDAQLWSDCMIRNGGDVRSIPAAEAAGWVQSTMYTIDYKTQNYMEVVTTHPAPNGKDSYVRPWYAYWLLALEPNLTLIVPLP